MFLTLLYFQSFVLLLDDELILIFKFDNVITQNRLNPKIMKILKIVGSLWCKLKSF